jgi:hypothetical protein
MTNAEMIKSLRESLQTMPDDMKDSIRQAIEFYSNPEGPNPYGYQPSSPPPPGPAFTAKVTINGEELSRDYRSSDPFR